MQFNFAAIIASALITASPAIAASAQWFAGAECTGALVGTSNNIQGAGCVFLTNGGAGKSIRYSDTQSIQFFVSGGPHDFCLGESQLTRSGSGCATAPPDFNWQSFTAR